MVSPRDDDLNLLGESDAEWSGDANDRKLTSGYLFKFSDSEECVSWQTKTAN